MTTFSALLAAGVVLVAWLTAGGMTVRTVSRIWLRHWAEQRLRGASVAMTYLERPQRLLTAASAGVAVTVVLAGLLLGAGHTGSHVRFSIALFLYALALLALGQILPRAIARRWPSELVPLVMPVLRGAELVAAPVLALGRAVARFVGRPVDARDRADRDPIQDLLREGELEGVGEREEIAIITGVVEFGEKIARDVMTPRGEIFALPVDAGPREIALGVAQSGYSRVPLYRGALDDIAGMVHAFDVLKAAGERPPAIRAVAHASGETPCTDLLTQMLRARRHLAIVRDAAGRTIGLVTLEDLLEELVGDIRDEYDEPEAPAARG
ncbi:MAG: CNNM domain-containing protein [Gemmatimonadota bacterium]|nr:CNNM domain-containing protein [Gemmatimonadota bacterium]